jgi:signal transduction histidine kinase
MERTAPSEDSPVEAVDVRMVAAMRAVLASSALVTVSGLRESVKQGDSLVSSIRRYAGRFEEATGITISVESAPGPRVNDRLAAEVFQMIAEGLSNIRRHTDSRTGAVKITFLNDQLVLTIENDGADPVIPPKFIPRSISDRTASLGGSVRVEHDTNGRTAVIAEVPL